MQTRRTLMLSCAALAAGASAAPAAPASSKRIAIYKANGCTCCEGWVLHLQKAGFITAVQVRDNILELTAKRGVKDEFSSCHFGEVGGYVLVGHIPAEDVQKLLREKPKAIGLSVPAMPIGSPGMEISSGKVEPYRTLLLHPGGKVTVFARHGSPI